jgi:AraC-like DNA-binding protein
MFWLGRMLRAGRSYHCCAQPPSLASSPISSPFRCQTAYLWRESSRGLSGWSGPNGWPTGMMVTTSLCRCSCSRPGLALYETNHPYLLDQPQSGQDLIVLRVPRRHLGLKDRLITDLCGRTIDQSVPGMTAFTGYAAGLVAGRGHMDDRARVELGHISTDLLSLALRSFAGFQQTSRSEDETLLESAKGHIRQCLADPDLTVEQLASAENVSVRKLHDVFAAIGDTPAAYIRRRRMERATALLAARHQNRQSVASIAIACGFRDTSTFIRAFTRVYQCTPTQWPLTADTLDAATVTSAD